MRLKHELNQTRGLFVKSLFGFTWFVKVCSERDQDLLVQQNQLPQLSHLTLDVPHQRLIEKFDACDS